MNRSDETLEQVILRLTGARELHKLADIQTLWSGYGMISRYQLVGTDRHRVVVKQIALHQPSQHPRGWNSDLSHQRKVQS